MILKEITYCSRLPESTSFLTSSTVIVKQEIVNTIFTINTKDLEIRNLLPPVAEERAKTTSAGKNRDGEEQWDCKIYFIK